MGAWKNFQDLEENLTMAELGALIEGVRKEDMENKKFMAALQGVDLEKNSKKDANFEAVRTRAMARITGKSEEEVALAKIGIAIATE